MKHCSFTENLKKVKKYYIQHNSEFWFRWFLYYLNQRWYENGKLFCNVILCLDNLYFDNYKLKIDETHPKQLINVCIHF